MKILLFLPLLALLGVAPAEEHISTRSCVNDRCIECVNAVCHKVPRDASDGEQSSSSITHCATINGRTNCETRVCRDGVCHTIPRKHETPEEELSRRNIIVKRGADEDRTVGYRDDHTQNVQCDRRGCYISFQSGNTDTVHLKNASYRPFLREKPWRQRGNDKPNVDIVEYQNVTYNDAFSFYVSCNGQGLKSTIPGHGPGCYMSVNGKSYGYKNFATSKLQQDGVKIRCSKKMTNDEGAYSNVCEECYYNDCRQFMERPSCH